MRAGAASRLERVEEILAGADDEGADPAALASVLAELDAAGTELGTFAQGLRPRLLTEEGLAAALADLVRRGGVPVELRVARPRFPPAIESAAYFVCAEALANIGKHAPSARATIEVAQVDTRLIVTVRDDGEGGASFDAGLRAPRPGRPCRGPRGPIRGRESAWGGDDSHGRASDRRAVSVSRRYAATGGRCRSPVRPSRAHPRP